MLQVPTSPDLQLQCSQHQLFLGPIPTCKKEEVDQIDILKITESTSPQKIKSSKRHTFKNHLPINSFNAVENWIKQSLDLIKIMQKYMNSLKYTAEYDDYLNLQAYKNSLIDLQKEHGNYQLSNGRKLKFFLFPHITEVEKHIKQLLEIKEINALTKKEINARVKLERVAAIWKGRRTRDNTVTAKKKI